MGWWFSILLGHGGEIVYAILNKDKKVIGLIEYEPSTEDLRTRGETFVFSTGLSLGDTYEQKEVDK